MRHLLVTLMSLGALLAPTVARSDAVRATLGPLPAEVRAGEMIIVRWSDPGADVDELEILLSVDDGHTFPLRISPELDGRTRSLRWRVPDLPAGAARLRVRVGDSRVELEGEPSAAFRIVGSPDGRGEGPNNVVHEGWWWERLGAPRGAAPAAMSANGPPRVARRDAVPPAACGPPLQFAGHAATARAHGLCATVASAPARAPIRHGAAPARVHPRN